MNLNGDFNKAIAFKPDYSELASELRSEIDKGIAIVKQYKPYLKQKEYAKYAKVLLKDDASEEQSLTASGPSDLLSLAINSSCISSSLQDIASSISS